MKKLSLLLLLSASAPQLFADCDCQTTSHTFFSVRPLYQSASPERVTFFREHEQVENGWGGSLQLTLMGGKSTKTDHLTRYFQPFCKETLQVNEVNTGGDLFYDRKTDLLARNFNILTQLGTFASTISIKPHQSVFGIGLTYRQNLGTWFSCFDDCDHPWWVEISSPLVRIHNRVTLNEHVQEYGNGIGTAPGLPETQSIVANMTDAFKQKDWLYGKIDENAKMTKWGLADIELKLGYGWVNSECCGFESYVGAIIPTGNKPNAEYVFEPMIGRNKHWGIEFGSSAHYSLYESDCLSVTAYLDMNTEYLFKRKERRSFDLNNKPWSRYMAVYANFAQAEQADGLADVNAKRLLATPGINVFTQDLNIKPGLSHTMNWGLAAEYQGVDAEIGFNLFARQAECASFASNMPSTLAFKAYDGNGETNQFILINQDVSGMNIPFGQPDYDNSVITTDDVDLASATHPSVISYNIYGALGYKFDDYCYPMFVGLGAGYDFGRGNEVLHRWTAWGKFGITF